MAHRVLILAAALLGALVVGAGAGSPTPRLAAGETPGSPLPGLGGGSRIDVPPGGGLFSTEPPLEDGEQDLRPGTPMSGEGQDGPTPVVHYGEGDLPAAVRQTRAALIEAAKTGDLESLRPLIEKTDPPTVVSDLDGGDPIEVMRSESGDEEGREVLAILLDVLDAGWVKVDEGTPRERIVWPYFARYPLDALTPAQTVEMFRVMTAGDFEGMKTEGGYTFFRVEIGADGKWLAYVSGE